MADKFDSKFGQIVAIPFGKADITTGAANEDCAMINGGTYTPMLHAGSVVGIGITANTGLISAGSIVASAHKLSTELSNTPTPTLDATNSLASYSSIRPGVCTFSAGDKLGVSLNVPSTALSSTNTVHVDAMLYVLYEPA